MKLKSYIALEAAKMIAAKGCGKIKKSFNEYFAEINEESIVFTATEIKAVRIMRLTNKRDSPRLIQQELGLSPKECKQLEKKLRMLM